jgi:phage terminase large subunit-like protein
MEGIAVTTATRSKAPPRPHVAAALAYAEGVRSGKILACKWIKLACVRHLEDYKRSKRADYPFKFDKDEAEKRCQRAELFPHVKGHWAIPDPKNPGSTRIRLEPWQCFIRSSIYGWKEKATGLRRFRVAYIEVPRKNSKSTMAAIDGHEFLACDGEFGAEVYSGATSEKQAWEVFRPAKQMAERTPEYREAYGVVVNASNLAILENGSRFEPVIGKPGDGASPSLAIIDEYHEHPDSTLVDTMLTGMGARRQPLLLVITTAGDNLAGPCYAMHTQVEKMLEGVQPNDRLFGMIYTIDQGDDWTTETALRKANPNYGVSVGAEFLKQQQKEAIDSSRQQGVFKTKHLNVWVTARDAWMNMEWWNRQADRTLKAEDFTGFPCFAGGDLASKLDLASVVRVFRKNLPDGPPGDDGEPTERPHYYAFGRHYLPEKTVEDPKNRHYQGWVHDGWLTATDGDMTDYSRIRADLLEDARVHGIEQAGFDPWGSQEMIQELTRQGITAVEIPQTVKYLSDPMKSLEALVKSGQFHHTGDEVLTWAVSNVTVREDANENIFPRKDMPELKIDPAAALLNATSRAILAPVSEPRIRVL